MGEPEVEAFLTHLAVNGRVSASTKNQALAAILFLYQKVLDREIGRLDAVRAKRSVTGPVLGSRRNKSDYCDLLFFASEVFPKAFFPIGI